MASSKCILLGKSTPWKTAVLLTFSVLIANFSGYGIFYVSITALALIISAIIFKFSKQIEDQEIVVQAVQQKGIHQDSTTLLDQIGERVQGFQDIRDGDDEKCCSSEVTEESSQVGELKPETVTTQESNNAIQHGLHSESESIDPSCSSEYSDIDWPYPYSCNFGRSPECSDDSISDEESLIEIAIPSGHSFSPKQDLKKFQNLSGKTFLDQEQEMVELSEINDMYEEDNLIEIDLSV